MKTMVRKIPVHSYIPLEMYDDLESYRIKHNYNRSAVIEKAIGLFLAEVQPKPNKSEEIKRKRHESVGIKA